MKTTQLQKALILVAIATGLFAAGCELIVDFDRTKIPVESIDAGPLPDASGLGDGAPTNDGGDGGIVDEAGVDEAGVDEAGTDDAGDGGDGSTT